MATVSDVSLFEPAMQPHQFKPTGDEIELAECIQRATTRRITGSISRDAAMRVLKESGLSHKEIREIWTIADRDGNGKLSNKELCAVVRLAGWVQQRGEKASESLLAAAGPLPVLKGISSTPRRPEGYTTECDYPSRFCRPDDISTAVSELQQTGACDFSDQFPEWHRPRPQLVYPPINVVHMQTCKSLFERAGHINGLMDRETAQEALMRHFNAPFSLLKTIFNLVRRSNRLSLNIFEFTLAAYFVEGLQSGQINTLPSEVPSGLYDQLWTPLLLNASPMSATDGADEGRPDSMASSEQSSVTSAQSSTTDLGVAAAPRLSPVRKELPSSFSGHCPSVSSVERKKISKLWKRVAEHCKIEKLLTVSSTRNRKNKRESVLSSDASINGIAYTLSSSGSSFEAVERDSFLEPTRGQRVSMDDTRLPLIYPSETGFYTSPGPVPTDSQYSFSLEKHQPDNITRYSSQVRRDEGPNIGDPGETMSVISAISLEEQVGYKGDIGNIEAEAADTADSNVIAMLKDMKEGYTFLKLQMQIMQKTIQKLGSNGRPTTKNVHFASDVDLDLGERVRDSIQIDSGPSRRTEALKLSKELVGPRDMLSTRSDLSITGSRSTSHGYGYDHRRHRQQRGKSGRVLGPRTRDRDSESSSTYSLSSQEMLSDTETASILEAPDYQRMPEAPNGNTNAALPLRSILKIHDDRPLKRRIRIVDHDGRRNNAKNSVATQKYRKRATRRSGMTEETLQAWNARFIPVERVLESREEISVIKQLRKLPRTPRKLPTPGVSPTLSKLSRSRHLPSPPMASSSKFPGALADDEYSTSHVDDDADTASYLGTELSQGDTETVPSSASSTPRSSADLSSLFSRRRHSARTTLLTEIDEYNDTVVRDLKEVAPQLVLHVKKCLLRELRTKSDGMYDGVRGGLEALSQSSMAQKLEEAQAQIRAKEEELRRLEDAHANVLRQRAKEFAKLEQEKDELRWTVADQEEQISSLTGAAIESGYSFELPEYTPSCSSSGW